MALPRERYTFENLRALPDDGFRHELIDGELHVSPAPSVLHQLAILKLSALLEAFVLEHRLGLVLQAPTDVKLGEFTGVQPDIVFVRRGRAAVVTSQFIDGPPDLVVEVLSPSTRQYDLALKRAAYARAGIPEYWIIDPAEGSAALLTLEDGDYVPLPSEGGRAASRVLPGFALDPAAFLATVRARLDDFGV